MIDKTDPTNRDTVAAMLTPGEFVLNKEAVQLFGPKIEAMNRKGLELRQARNMGGVIADNQYNIGGWINKAGNALTGGAYNPYISQDLVEYYGDRYNLSYAEALEKAKDEERRKIKNARNPKRGQLDNLDLPTRQTEPNPYAVNKNHGGQIPGYNWGGWISSLFQPDENSVIGQNLNPAHIRAVPPGYGAEPPVPQPEFVPQAQPGQQVQGGFAPGIPEEFSGAYRPERPPTYITDIPQEGTGAQHDRSTIIPSAASIPNIKGAQAGIVPPTQASVIQEQAQQVVPGTDEALLQTSSDHADSIVSQQETDPLLAREAAYARDRFAGQEGPGANIPLQAQDVGAVPPGFGAEVPQPEFVPQPGAEGYAAYSPQDFLNESQGVPPEETGAGPVDWNSLQGAGFGGPAINEEVEDKVIQEATFEADNAIESAKAQEANLLQQAQQAADQGDFATANKLNEEATGIVAQAEAAKDEQVGALEEQYAAGKQARIDAENQWRESQGLPPKPPGEEIVAPDGEGGTEVVQPKVEPNSEQADAGVADVTAQAVEAAGEIPAEMTSGAVEKAGANATPQQKSEGKQAVKGAFGDLIDNKELGRMALLFAGALLTGASPQQALAIAGKSYLQRVDAKNANSEKHFQSLVKGGKYTPGSIKAYKDSGDPSDLIANEQAQTFKQLGNQKEFYGSKGQRILATEVEDGAGNKIWLDKSGKPVNLTTHHQDPSRAPNTPEYRKRIEDSSKKLSGDFKELQERFGKFKDKDGNEIFSTDLTPGKVGDNAAKWAIRNNVPPEDMGSLLDNAYAGARADSQGGKRVRNIEAYLNSQFIQSQVGDPSLFEQANGDPASGEKVTTLMNNIARNAGLQGSTISNSTTIMQKARPMWAALDDETRKSYNRRAGPGQSGFMVFLQTELQSGVS